MKYFQALCFMFVGRLQSNFQINLKKLFVLQNILVALMICCLQHLCFHYCFGDALNCMGQFCDVRLICLAQWFFHSEQEN